MTSCPACGTPGPKAFLERARFPTMQNHVYRSRASALHTERADVNLVACPVCTFVHNRDFEPENMRYDADYDNTVDCSPLFLEHYDERGRALRAAVPFNGTVVEIGCGKGTFLERFAKAAPDASAIGIDATYEGDLSACEGRIRFERRFFGGPQETLAADAIVCRHVIEHVPDPLSFLVNIRAGMRNSANATLFFETPSLEWIVEQRAVWDIFYEHCNYFTDTALRRCFERAGFSVVALERVFGGQYFWLEARLSEPVSRTVAAPEGIDSILDFGAYESDVRESLRGRLGEAAARERIAIWGAGAKGTTLANIVDPDASIISAFIDINPRKQGGYIAGSGHRIIAPSEIGACGIQTIFVMNPQYTAEIARMLAESGGTSVLCDLPGLPSG